MTALWVIGGYVVVALVVTMSWAVHEYKTHKKPGKKATDGDLSLYLFMGAFIGFLWPAFVPVLVIRALFAPVGWCFRWITRRMDRED